ncbi:MULTISPECIES: DUF1294 domain-containing protein [Virgibacillus]|uniref:Uncharacterized membrane protein YsdA, DUF1294 family n=1 Tax=Virgibacillus chiguensis TaxID=411959 RepID=A0A1M5V3R0_9BACI|nr:MULTISPECIES: DUF1294 domain-containing protein [Virgibacillus]SHH69836.1 Uncharacterized membrane protein YsdA, DUF1294 family [Virgibacillus chiguensis]
MNQWNTILFYLLGVNSIAFVLMGMDKRKAEQKQYRIPERTLWMLAILGGALGIWLGMKLYRHKTRHRRFIFGIPVLFFGHCLFLIYYMFNGLV